MKRHRNNAAPSEVPANGIKIPCISSIFIQNSNNMYVINKHYYSCTQHSLCKFAIYAINYKIVEKNRAFVCYSIFRTSFGELAQLGERMTGSHEVRGSIPLFSTKCSRPGIYPWPFCLVKLNHIPIAANIGHLSNS